MASKGPGEPHAQPEIGDTLVVVHDFLARSSDELSLAKGDRVELIERDDEYRDGWYLGRHLVNGNTGLFPEAYTRPAPKIGTMPSLVPLQPLPTLIESESDAHSTGIELFPSQVQRPAELASTPVLVPKVVPPPITKPLNAVKPEPEHVIRASEPILPSPGLGQLNNTSQDSQVLNDTLNVINEHITDLRSPTSNTASRAPTTDSGSEYSAPLDRMSYIQGDETDEEEEATHTRPEVAAWTPDDVAEFLFTAGAEKSHCDMFRDQEISGEVLLGMDQSSLFIKDFNLGSVGRRLKTWHKIKALQDQVSQGTATRRATQTYGSEAGSEDMRRKSRSNTLTDPIDTRRLSTQSKRLSMTQTPRGSPTTLTAPLSSSLFQDSPGRPSHANRPSAASVRELHQSRRHSSTDFTRWTGARSTGNTPKLQSTGTFPEGNGAHKKQPSFDRNWTIGSAFTQTPSRPLSSAGLQDVARASNPELQDSAVDLDRGYFSGTEADGRKRNVLRKRDSNNHSRQNSYTEEQRVRSATAISRHSRFGSMGSYRDGGGTSAAQRYYGLQADAHKRTASANTTESFRPVPPAKDVPPPTVTKLDSAVAPNNSQASVVGTRRDGFAPDWLAAVMHKPATKGFGVRAISDNLAIGMSKRGGSDSPGNERPLVSPSRTGSSTASGGASFEMESPDTAKSPSSATTPASKYSRKKGKKETSAYTRGLLKISPKEAIIDADYSGWMRKKSSHLMTTWKPRLFVLKGRRLAYYYALDDDQERGLIDISFHRVLPANHERMTGLHATISSAVPSLQGSHLLGSMPESQTELAKGDEPMFIFKLVPPRAGLSRAVTFTKPTVHYFAVPSLKQGRLWMAALMKATIDRDDLQPITSTYQQKTISLAKAKQMRHRPPALMNLEEDNEEQQLEEPSQPQSPATEDSKKDSNGLGIFSEADSGVSEMDKLGAQKIESPSLGIDFGGDSKFAVPPSPST